MRLPWRKPPLPVSEHDAGINPDDIPPSSKSDMDRQAAILKDLLLYVADQPRLGDVDWSGLAMVVRSAPDGRRVDQMYGSIFMADGSPRSSGLTLLDVGPFFERLLALEDGRGPWIRALVQIDRPSGNVRVQFEYDDPHKWEPDFHDTLGTVDRIRPTFADGSS